MSQTNLGPAIAQSDNTVPVKFDTSTYQVTAGNTAIPYGATQNAEIGVYLKNVLANGGYISAQHINAIDKFISTGKANGWWSAIVDCCPFAGENLNSALTKLVSASNTPYITNNGVTANEYSRATGIQLTDPYNSAGQYLDCGFSFGGAGLSSQNFSIGTMFGRETYGDGVGWIVGTNPAAGDTSIIIYNGMLGFGGGNFNQGCAFNSTHFFGGTITSGYAGIFTAGSEVASTTSTSFTFDMTGNMSVFKVTRNGTPYYIGGGILFYFVGSYMTPAQMSSLSLAADQLALDMGRVSSSLPQTIFFGDSITEGYGATYPQNRWTAIVNQNFGLREINVGVGGCQAGQKNSTIDGLNTIGPNVLASLPYDYAFMVIGTNDMNADNNSTGSGTFTATISAGGTSATLTSSLSNGSYQFVFSDGETRVVTITGGTSASWTGGLTNSVTTAFGYYNINSSAISAMTTSMNQVLAAVRNINKPIVVGTIPYNTANSNSVDAKFFAYNLAISSLCRSYSNYAGQTVAPIRLIDVYSAFRAQGTTAAGSLLFTDNLHPNDKGHYTIGKAMSGGPLNSYYIDFKDTTYTTFPTISGNSSGSVNLRVFGVYPGQIVTVTPAVSETSLVLTAQVLNADYVTVTAYNPTLLAVTTPQINMRVGVQF